MTTILRKHLDDEKLNSLTISRIIRDAVNAMPIPEFEYENRMPKSLIPQGVLEGKKGEDFFDKARNHANKLCKDLRKKSKEYIKHFASEMKKVRFDELLLAEFQEYRITLEKRIENKEMELKRINLIKGELEGIGGEQ